MESFMFYKDVISDKFYITRDIYEKAQKKEIELNATPKVIQGHNTYQIEEKKLRNIEKELSLKGIENIVEFPLREEPKERVKELEKEDNSIPLEKRNVYCCSVEDSIFIPLEIISLLEKDPESTRKIKVDEVLFGEVNGEELIQIRKNAKKRNQNIQYQFLNIRKKEKENNNTK